MMEIGKVKVDNKFVTGYKDIHRDVSSLQSYIREELDKLLEVEGYYNKQWLVEFKITEIEDIPTL